jgi:hypothetical protein
MVLSKESNLNPIIPLKSLPISRKYRSQRNTMNYIISIIRKTPTMGEMAQVHQQISCEEKDREKPVN